eukprot:ANDGO_00796.mRNA.1 hypothetical protein
MKRSGRQLSALVIADPELVYSAFREHLQKLLESRTLLEFAFSPEPVPLSLEDALRTAWSTSEDGKQLVLAHWFIALVYPYAWNEAKTARSICDEMESRNGIDDTRSSSDGGGGREEWLRSKRLDELCSLLRERLLSCAIALMISADNYTAWNLRRRAVLLLDEHSESTERMLDSESHLNAVVLSKHPKSDETWTYRNWLFSGMFSTQQQAFERLASEWKLVVMLSEQYRRNYPAWSHWIRVFRRVQKFHTPRDLLVLIEGPSKDVCSRRVADHSALHARSVLWSFLGNLDAEAVQELMEDEDLWLRDLICRYPGHESLWMYRRFICFRRYAAPHPTVSAQKSNGLPQTTQLKFLCHMPAGCVVDDDQMAQRRKELNDIAQLHRSLLSQLSEPWQSEWAWTCDRVLDFEPVSKDLQAQWAIRHLEWMRRC